METSPAMNELQTVLVKDVCTKKNTIIEIESNTSIYDALKILKDNKILSSPVFDKMDGIYIGMIDVIDILSFILQTYSEDQDPINMQWSTWVRDMETLSHRGTRFGMKPVKHIVNKSHIDRFIPVYEHGTLYQLIETVFCKGIHRVPVMNDDDKLVGMISQSDIIKYVVKNPNIIKMIGGHKSIEELNSPKYPIYNTNTITMSANASAIHAFYLMYYNKVSAVAIVDNDGKMVANLSASDVRGLTASQFGKLAEPCTNYIASIHNIDSDDTLTSSGQGEKLKKIPKPITVTKDTTLETVLLKLSYFKLHRVWVVDNRNRPIGLISLSDIMNLLTNLGNQ